MKRFFKYLVTITISMCVLVGFASCSGGIYEGYVYEGLVGRWRVQQAFLPDVARTSMIFYTFNDDGTGIRTDSRTDTRTGDEFTWGVSGETIIINRGSENISRREIRIERWDIEVAIHPRQPDRWRLTSQQEKYDNSSIYLLYVGAIDLALVGAWEMYMGSFISGIKYEFDNYGGGNIMAGDSAIAFVWGIDDGELRIFQEDTAVRRYNATVTDNMLRLGFVESDDLAIHFIRI